MNLTEIEAFKKEAEKEESNDSLSKEDIIITLPKAEINIS